MVPANRFQSFLQIRDPKATSPTKAMNPTVTPFQKFFIPLPQTLNPTTLQNRQTKKKGKRAIQTARVKEACAQNGKRKANEFSTSTPLYIALPTAAHTCARARSRKISRQQRALSLFAAGASGLLSPRALIESPGRAVEARGVYTPPRQLETSSRGGLEFSP